MPEFDPFNDRLARDIRNALSEAMVANLPTLDLDPVRQCAATFSIRELSAAHRAYIEDRLSRYHNVFALLRKQAEHDPFRQSLALWDAGLFFEVHEVIERLWKESQGDQKSALQAMFRAAGTYVHLEQGNPVAARSMADKAIQGLTSHGACLPATFDLAPLISALQQLTQPPRLG
ncbi:MAG: DUF309 domain-containing protein [Desulfobulbaceae bacterium]|nr:DUF309 domain-containing protein [Desulfobulbaceae bacterium]